MVRDTSPCVNIINLFANHRVAPSLAMIVMLLAGAMALMSLNVGLNPTMQPTRVSVSILWRGASAEDVEKLITNPLEQQLRSVDNVKAIRSTTRDTNATVEVEMDDGTDMQKAMDDIKQSVAQIRGLPVEIEPPVIRLVEHRDMVASVLIKGNGEVDELLPLARRLETDLLNHGAESVEFSSLPRQEIAIQIPSQTLFEMGLSFNDIGTSLSQLSQDTPGGTVGSGQMSRQIRSLDQRRDTEEFNNLPLLTAGTDRLVRLGEIATIETRPIVDQPYATVEGEPAVQMMVMQKNGADAMKGARLLHDWVDEVTPTLPEGVTLTLFVEVWKFISDEIDLIMRNGLTGLVLVILALLIFLRFRVAMWIMIGMPVTFLAALLVFYYLGGTLNVLSLIAIVMALGIVVDDAIVVGEDAVTQFERGRTPAEAATHGARRMFFPVMASSLTTLCAFLPLLMQSGTPIFEIPLMMLCVIIASLVECFLILPGHLRVAFEKSVDKAPSRFHRWFNAAFEDFRETKFRPIVRMAMSNRRVVIAGAGSLFAIMITLWITGWIKTEMSLSINFEQVNADMQFVSGATPEQKRTFLGELEQQLKATDEAYGGGNVVSYITNYNTATINNERKTGAQFANIWLELTSPEQRDITANDFANAWLERVGRSPVVDSLTIKKSGRFWGDFSILLKGTDAGVLKTASAEAIAELSTLEGVTNVHDNLPYGKEQWIFELTTEGRSLGLTTASVGQQLRAAYDGQRIQIFHQDQNELEVRLVLPEWERTDLASLGQFPIKTPGGEMIPLRSVATWEGKRGFDVIRHHDGLRTIEVSGNVDINKISGGEVVKFFNTELKDRLSAKYGITTGLDGMSLAEQEETANFAFRYLIALCLIYIVLAWIFSSYTWPLAVMAAIPLGLTGALLGHFVMGMVIGPMSMLGLFTLTGIIVNDSIILVSAYQHLLKEGIAPKQAIEEAVCSRLRAVILTSVTTVAGLFPLMLEQAPMAAAFTPLAAAICFGMLYGTVLVLLVVPALLSSMITMTQWFETKRTRIYGPVEQTA